MGDCFEKDKIEEADQRSWEQRQAELFEAVRKQDRINEKIEWYQRVGGIMPKKIPCMIKLLINRRKK